MPEPTQAPLLYMLARELLLSLGDATAMSFLHGLPPAEAVDRRQVAAATLPVVAALDRLGDTSAATSKLVEAVAHRRADQAWRQPYKADDFGPEFAARSGWFPIADRHGPLVLTGGLVEIMLLDAGVTYPLHRHTPEELYVALAGSVWWEAHGDPDAPAWRSAGEAIHHPSNRRHALTAGPAAVLILALWRGGGFEKPEIG